MKPQPPRWASTLLSWWGHPDTREDVQGDLLELYAYWVQTVGERKANWRYCLSVLKLVRPLAKPKQSVEYPQPERRPPECRTTFLLSPDMLRNYIKIALRNLVKNKVSSFINISGLAVGMAVALLIGLWVWDELSYNKYHKNYDRIAQVMQNGTADGVVWTQEHNPPPLGNALRTNYRTDFRFVVMSSGTFPSILASGDKKFTKIGSSSEAEIAEMLTLNMVKGTRAGLKDPNSILLSESVANAFFGSTDPIGKIMRINDDRTLKVTGVYQDLPQNSHFNDMSFITKWDEREAYIKNHRDDWDYNSFRTYIQLADNADIDNVSAKIKNIKLDNVPKESRKYKPAMFLQPMAKWHLYSQFENGVNVGGRIQYVWLFGIIGLFVLLLACINFMNLSTARSEKRAKEVGLRKAVGSMRSQLVSQFFSESFLVVFLAFGLAIGLVIVSLKWFNELAEKQIAMPWANSYFWLASLGFILLTGFVAGSYPALYLSGFQPIKVLKGTFRVGRFAAVPRKVLVIVQFTVSVTLIIGTIIVYRQIQFAQNRPIGYSRDGLIMLQTPTPDVHTHFDVIRDELKNSGAIIEMAESHSPMTDLFLALTDFSWRGKDPNRQAGFGVIRVSPEFGKTVGWQFTDGRDFSREFITDSTGMVLNEAAVKYMGLTNPVGELIQTGPFLDKQPFKVIGVVKDMVMESPFKPVRPSIFLPNKYKGNFAILKINPSKSAREALSQAEAVFKKYAPTALFDYKFVDQEYAKKFGDEERIGNLASIFALLAIFISCLGLFGLASFVAEQRTKEIGVRKVLGATIFNLWSLLSKDFVYLVLIAVGIATPVAYYFLNNWLHKYEYRTEISWWIFALTGLGAILITLLTVSFQSIKAALMNPIKSLRSE